MKKIVISTLFALFTCFTSQAQEETSYNSSKFVSISANAIGGDVEEKLFSFGMRLGFEVSENLYLGPIIGYERRTSNPNGNYTYVSQILEYGAFFRNRFPITEKFFFTGDLQAAFLKDLENTDNSTTPFTGQFAINAEYRPIEKFSVRLLMGQLTYQAIETRSAWQLNYGLKNPVIELTHYF